MTRTFLRHPSLTVAACMLLLTAQLQVNAQHSLDHIKRRVQISIGQPSIWSLGQAHYFLAQMHDRNSDLRSKFPTEDELNPNKINSNHIEAFRSFLGIEANFDQGMGVENRLNMQKYKSDLARKEAAQTRLDEKVQERDQVEARIKTIKKRTTELGAEQDALGKVAEADRTDAQNQRLAQIKERIPKLTKQQSESENEKASLDEEVGTLTTQATATVSVPDLKTPEVEKTADKTGKLPESELYKEFIKDAFTNPTKPSISVQTTLDNFIQMQYEIISKQLTLLRDEVGPDYRVVFLELPASIYTVDEKADDYVA